MNPKTEQMKKEVGAFFKAAFCVDGNVKIYATDFEDFKITGVVELNDSKRGKFYVARVVKLKGK